MASGERAEAAVLTSGSAKIRAERWVAHNHHERPGAGASWKYHHLAAGKRALRSV